MSQLDVTISFSQFLGLIFLFLLFLFFINIIIYQYWYNNLIRNEDKIKTIINKTNLNSSNILRKILSF